MRARDSSELGHGLVEGGLELDPFFVGAAFVGVFGEGELFEGVIDLVAGGVRGNAQEFPPGFAAATFGDGEVALECLLNRRAAPALPGALGLNILGDGGQVVADFAPAIAGEDAGSLETFAVAIENEVEVNGGG